MLLVRYRGRSLRSRLAEVRFVQRWGGPPRAEDLGLGAHVDQTDAPYMPTNDSAVENALRTVAVSRRSLCIWGATAGAGRLWC